MASLPDLFLAQANAAANLQNANDAQTLAVRAYEAATLAVADALTNIKTAMAQVQSL